jgi:hypothetical protein
MSETTEPVGSYGGCEENNLLEWSRIIEMIKTDDDDSTGGFMC